MEQTRLPDTVRPSVLRSLGVMALTALASGCGGGGGGGGGVTSAPPPVIAPTPAPAPAPTPPPAPAPVPTATPTAAFQTSEYNRSTGPAQHGAVAAWSNGYNGSGIVIGIVDSGIERTNPEFTGRISAASADVAGTRGLANPDSDHGTKVAMVAAAARDNTGIMGMAWNATIAMFRTDSPGSCATYDAAKKDSGCKYSDNAIASGIDSAVSAGARVINVSLGGTPANATLRSAVSRATAAGVVIVISAGNEGDSTETGVDPLNPDPLAQDMVAAGNGAVIIAGSVDKDNAFSAFSNKAGNSARWFLSARGERICCVYENGAMKIVDNPDGTRSVYVFSGTSFAAPQISGAIALLRQAFPNLSAQQAVDLLLRTATDAGAPGTDGTFGRGIMNIAAAFAPQGQTALAGSTAALALADLSGLTSAPMGDAANLAAGVSAVVLDGYGRAYRYDPVAAMRGAQVRPKLEAALRNDLRNLSVSNDKLSLAFSVDARGAVARLPWQAALRLSRTDAEQARVLAARAVARIAPDRMIGFGFEQGFDGLVAQMQGRSQPAFLVAPSPLDDLGFGTSGQMGFALRQQLGPWGLAASVERGKAQVRATGSLDPSTSQRLAGVAVTRVGFSLDRTLGALDGAVGLSWLNERHSVLGARFQSALVPGGANSLLLDASAGWRPAPRWRLNAAWRSAFTQMHGGGAASGSRLIANAWAIDAMRSDVFQANDVMGMRVSQPLRVARGGLNMVLPVDYSYATLSPTFATRTIGLTPSGRELNAEMMWRGDLAGGAAMASVFYRHNPGHYAALPAEHGVAASWTKKF